MSQHLFLLQLNKLKLCRHLVGMDYAQMLELFVSTFSANFHWNALLTASILCKLNPPLFWVDLANGSFGSGSIWVKFGSGKVRVTQILFGFDSG